jgi:hypothetical protein
VKAEFKLTDYGPAFWLSLEANSCYRLILRN